MKKLYYLLALGALIAGCSKKSSFTPAGAKGLTGSYKLYSIVDTVYNTPNTNNSIEFINHKNAGGDTTYLNPGTTFYRVEPNPSGNYNGTFVMADTMKFTSATKGTYSDHLGDSYGFTYNLATRAYNDGAVEDGVTENMIVLPGNKLQIIVTSMQDGAPFERLSWFYAKLN